MNRKRIGCAALLATCLLAACVKTGSVVEQQSLTQKLPRGKTVAVVVHAPNADLKDDAEHFKEGLSKELGDKGWKFGEKPDFICDVTFIEFDKGSKGERIFGVGGEAELHAVVVVQSGGGSTLAKFDVTGNSKRQSTTTIGGFNTSWADSLPARAVRAAVEQISEYLQTHG